MKQGSVIGVVLPNEDLPTLGEWGESDSVTDAVIVPPLFIRRIVMKVFYNDACRALKCLLEYWGEDPEREGLQETPERALRGFAELFAGYHRNPSDLFKTFSSDGYDELVLLREVEFYSTCEHHLLPFFGKAHVAYIPNGKVVGISKLARLLDIYARRLQIQERLCIQVTKALDEHLQPLGSACILEATHSCMTCRGVSKQHSVMVTSSLTGAFREEPETRSELLRLIGK